MGSICDLPVCHGDVFSLCWGSVRAAGSSPLSYSGTCLGRGGDGVPWTDHAPCPCHPAASGQTEKLEDQDPREERTQRNGWSWEKGMDKVSGENRHNNNLYFVFKIGFFSVLSSEQCSYRWLNRANGTKTLITLLLLLLLLCNNQMW